VTIPIDTIRGEAVAAKNSESAEKLFRWLRLNQWLSLKRTSWLPLTLWDETEGTWRPEEMAGRYCYLGLDLSSTTDLTAIALLFPPQAGVTEWRCLFKAFCPAENMNERVRRDHVPYDVWERQGWLTATEGSAVDYGVVQSQIEAYVRQYKVKYVCADEWNSSMLVQNLAKKGIQTIVVKQSMGGLSPSMKHIEKVLRSKELSHDDNPVARWCFGNTMIAIDGNENIKPMKNKSLERIDLTVALIDAMAVAMQLEQKTSAYEERELLVL